MYLKDVDWLDHETIVGQVMDFPTAWDIDGELPITYHVPTDAFYVNELWYDKTNDEWLLIDIDNFFITDDIEKLFKEEYLSEVMQCV